MWRRRNASGCKDDAYSGNKHNGKRNQHMVTAVASVVSAHGHVQTCKRMAFKAFNTTPVADDCPCFVSRFCQCMINWEMSLKSPRTV
jgi:hypothetical protein